VDHTPPREACGVFGVYGPGLSVAHLTYDGIYAFSTAARSRRAWP